MNWTGREEPSSGQGAGRRSPDPRPLVSLAYLGTSTHCLGHRPRVVGEGQGSPVHAVERQGWRWGWTQDSSWEMRGNSQDDLTALQSLVQISRIRMGNFPPPSSAPSRFPGSAHRAHTACCPPSPGVPSSSPGPCMIRLAEALGSAGQLAWPGDSPEPESLFPLLKGGSSPTPPLSSP